MTKQLKYQFRLGGCDVTVPQWRALYFLWMKEGRSQKEIVEYVGSEKAAVARLMAGLEKRAWIRREECPNDARKKLVYLTDVGRDLPKQLIPLADRALDAADQGLDPAEVAVCIKVLEQVIDNLSDETGVRLFDPVD